MSERRARGAWIAGGAWALALGGCLPIAWSQTLSPPIRGVYLGGDGAPRAGVPVALSVEHGDSTCARPAQRVETDSAGRFGFSGQAERHRFVLLLPVDYAVPEYRLCTWSADTASVIYRAHLPPHARAPGEPATLRCAEQEGTPRVRCAPTGRP